MDVRHILYRAGDKYTNNKENRHKIALQPDLCAENLLTASILRGVFLANHLASTDN